MESYLELDFLEHGRNVAKSKQAPFPGHSRTSAGGYEGYGPRKGTSSRKPRDANRTAGADEGSVVYAYGTWMWVAVEEAVSDELLEVALRRSRR